MGARAGQIIAGGLVSKPNPVSVPNSEGMGRRVGRLSAQLAEAVAGLEPEGPCLERLSA